MSLVCKVQGNKTGLKSASQFKINCVIKSFNVLILIPLDTCTATWKPVLSPNQYHLYLRWLLTICLQILLTLQEIKMIWKSSWVFVNRIVTALWREKVCRGGSLSHAHLRHGVHQVLVTGKLQTIQKNCWTNLVFETSWWLSQRLLKVVGQTSKGWQNIWEPNEQRPTVYMTNC